ncbi:MAG: methyltransferase [Angelakisella sp.]
MPESQITFEQLGAAFQIAVSPAHKFGTDAFLLAAFSLPQTINTKPLRCCDLCSGCGIIPVLWFRWGAPVAHACAVELMPQGAAQLETTIAQNALFGRLQSICADLANLHGTLNGGSFDLVTCNPPYQIAGHGVPSPDPVRLAARHEVSCSLDEVCLSAARLLRFGGRFCLCQRPERLPDIFDAMRRAKLEPKRLRLVQQHPGKAPWLVLVEGRRGGKPFLQVEPPLLVENPDGSFTDEMLRIYRSGGKKDE